MTDQLHAWGLYPWFQEQGEARIHPEDLQAFKNLKPYGKVFEQIGSIEEYIVLQYNKIKYRVKKDLFTVLPISPVFTFGDRVEDINHPDRVGTICDIEWHHKDKQFIYFIEINEKKSSKRYYDRDLTRHSRK